MISQRTSGLNAVLALCQILLTVWLFWMELMLLLVVGGGGVVSWRAYAGFCVVLLIGLLIEMLSKKRLETGTIHHDFVGAHRLSFRQTVFSVGLLFIYVFGAKNSATLSRVFTAVFVPSLYAMLFLTNRYLPRLLGNRFFGEERWERTLLVGRVARAEALRPWLERKTDVGFRTVGILCDDDPWELEKVRLPASGRHARDGG